MNYEDIDPAQSMAPQAQAAQKQPSFMDMQQAQALAHAYGIFPEMEDLQKRMAMAQALRGKEPAHHTTALGGMFGALGDVLKTKHSMDLEKQYQGQMAQLRPTYEQAMIEAWRKSGQLPPAQSQGEISPDVDPAQDLSGY